MKYKIVGTLVGFLLLPTVYLLSVITGKLGVSAVAILVTLSLTLAGYWAGKLFADTE